MLGDLFEIAAMLPWWVGVVLAIIVYVGLHKVAAMEIVVGTKPGQIGATVGLQIWKTFATLFQYIFPIVLLGGAGASAIARYRRRVLVDGVVKSDSDGVLERMTWQEFELLVGEAYRRKGFSVVESGGGGADGGVDLVLKKGSETFLVQCKQWRALKVGVTVVRELYGVMAARGAAGGVVVTSGRFSDDAAAFAKGRNIELVDGPKLAQLIRGVPSPRPAAPGAARIREPASDSGTPLCPRCGKTMARRVAKQGASAGKPFWGCPGFPGCRGTRPIET